MAANAKSISLVALLFSLTACTRPVHDAAGIARLFANAEYIPSRGVSADGWAEARRRQLLKKFLHEGGFTTSETQFPLKGNPHSKYRDVVLAVAGRGSETMQVSLALIPQESGPVTAQFRAAQAACDLRLVQVLQSLAQHVNQKHSIGFSVTENCIDLTEREPTED